MEGATRRLADEMYGGDIMRASTFTSQQAWKTIEFDVDDETKPLRNVKLQSARGYINGTREATAFTTHWRNLSALAETAAAVPKLVGTDLLMEIAAKNLSDHNGLEISDASMLAANLCRLGVGNAVATAREACE